MEIFSYKINEFAERLRYTPTKYLPVDIDVDHINKEYNINSDPYKVLFDIIFWVTPPFVYNAVKLSLKYQFNRNMTIDNIKKTIEELDIEITNTKYRHSNLYTILHPCSDITLRINFVKVITILLCKVFDKEDNYFNPDTKTCPIRLSLNDNAKSFLTKLSDFDLVLSGSNALALNGEVYREAIKDFDFLMDDKHLPKNIYDIVNEEITYNKIVGKDRHEVETTAKIMFENSKLYDKLNKALDNELIVNSAVIDRMAEYDNLTKVTFVLTYKDIDFDLIFRSNVSYDLFHTEYTTIKVQNINDVLYAKRILGRPKDFQDLMNFKAYNRLHNTNKCVVEYENE